MRRFPPVRARRRALALALVAGALGAGVLPGPPAHAAGEAPAPPTAATATAPPAPDPVAIARLALRQARLDARADRAALVEARRRLAKVTVELVDLEASLPVLRARIQDAYSLFTDSAQELYAGSSPAPALAADLFGEREAIAVGRANALAATSTSRANRNLDALRRARDALQKRVDEVRAVQRRQRALTRLLQAHMQTLSKRTRRLAADLRRAQAAQDALRYMLAVAARNQAYTAAANAAVAAGRPRPRLGRRSGPANPDDAARVPVERLVCPVDALVNFSDDWTQPRGNYRVHEGNDVFAKRGSPNVAVTDGVAERQVGGLGGNAIHLTAPDGTYYWYGHLDHFAGNWGPDGTRKVKQGEVLGFSGNTGNAAGGPVHTHFEIHPLGGPPWNPNHALREICLGQTHGKGQLRPEAGKYD
jgi:murein DD-endopeptidase MepM/ murein hydrolase activator NlpD